MGFDIKRLHNAFDLRIGSWSLLAIYFILIHPSWIAETMKIGSPVPVKAVFAVRNTLFTWQTWR